MVGQTRFCATHFFVPPNLRSDNQHITSLRSAPRFSYPIPLLSLTSTLHFAAKSTLHHLAHHQRLPYTWEQYVYARAQ